jgi:hypothetical protein
VTMNALEGLNNAKLSGNAVFTQPGPYRTSLSVSEYSYDPEMIAVIVDYFEQ